MINPLDDFNVYEAAEVQEAEDAVKKLRCPNAYNPYEVSLTLKHENNIRRMLRAGYKVYKSKDRKSVV